MATARIPFEPDSSDSGCNSSIESDEPAENDTNLETLHLMDKRNDTAQLRRLGKSKERTLISKQNVQIRNDHTCIQPFRNSKKVAQHRKQADREQHRLTSSPYSTPLQPGCRRIMRITEKLNLEGYIVCNDRVLKDPDKVTNYSFEEYINSSSEKAETKRNAYSSHHRYTVDANKPSKLDEPFHGYNVTGTPWSHFLADSCSLHNHLKQRYHSKRLDRTEYYSPAQIVAGLALRPMISTPMALKDKFVRELKPPDLDFIFTCNLEKYTMRTEATMPSTHQFAVGELVVIQNMRSTSKNTRRYRINEVFHVVSTAGNTSIISLWQEPISEQPRFSIHNNMIRSFNMLQNTNSNISMQNDDAFRQIENTLKLQNN